ncbi:MAG: patatin-like phospholipase family protein [Candidatus Hydrogenedentes bacterium]|nr:patatin-like phospholipase family protein [Candidatus Hydrogenedentota bacterium]
MAYHFKNLVFEGGGVKGIAYLGALQALEERGILNNIRRVGGTSAGAINATIMACGYSLEETEDILWNMDFNDFLDGTKWFFRDAKRMIKKFGWYKGDFFKRWIGHLIKAKTGKATTTFKELRELGGPELYVIGTNLSTRFAEAFSHEHTPNFPVRDAVRISMSIPLFFTAVRREGRGLYVDGGLFNNYPVKLFDQERYIQPKDRKKHALKTKYYQEEKRKRGRPAFKPVYNKETLGCRLDDLEEIQILEAGRKPKPKKISNFFQYTGALVGSVLNVQVNQHLHSDDWQRSVYVDTLDVKTKDFNLSNKKKRELVASGRKGVDLYFDWYDKAAAKAATRPACHPDYVDSPM